MKKILFLLLLAVGASTACTAQTLRNSNNSSIGKIERDGTIRDRNNSTIGRADGVPPEQAALFFFFSMP